MARNRPRRSWSTSAVRSAIPSLSTCCHSAVCCSASCASCLRRSRSSVSRRDVVGVVERRQLRAHRQGRDALPPKRFRRSPGRGPGRSPGTAPSRERNLTIAGKLDSSLSSLSLSCTAWLRSIDDAGIIGSATPARRAGARRWPRRSRASAGTGRSWSRQSSPTGQISRACRMNVISGSVNSWLVSLTPSASRRHRAAGRASPTGAAARDRRRRGCRRTPARP